MATVFALKQVHWGLVAVYLWSFEDVGEQPFAERCHQPGQLTGPAAHHIAIDLHRSEEHTSELQSLMRISYAVFCLKKQKKHNQSHQRQLTNTNQRTSYTNHISVQKD